MVKEGSTGSATDEPVSRDADAGRREGVGRVATAPSFRLKNIIGLPVLDLDIKPRMSLTTYPHYDILVFDPGQMVGFAGLCGEAVYERGRLTHVEFHIDVGQGEWHECLSFHAKRVFVETTPYAARRTFDPWPIRFDGMVRAILHPHGEEPESVYPTNLDVARHWFELPKKHGLGRHAKDALTHLVSVLVRESQA